MHFVSLCREKEGQIETLKHYLYGARTYGWFVWYSCNTMRLNSCTGKEILSIIAQWHVPNRDAWTYTREWTFMDTQTHVQSIHWRGHRIYTPFPGCKALLSHRRTSLGFHSIWCLAKASFVTDHVLQTPSWLKPLQGWGIFELLCGKRGMWGGALCTCVCVRLCSDGGLRWVQTSTGGEHTLAQHRGVKHGLMGRAGSQTVWMMCNCVLFTASEPHLTFWLSLPPREPLELGLNTQNVDKNEIFRVILRATLLCSFWFLLQD